MGGGAGGVSGAVTNVCEGRGTGGAAAASGGGELSGRRWRTERKRARLAVGARSGQGRWQVGGGGDEGARAREWCGVGN